MIVLVTTACPASLRGDITRWLFEISAGVYVGRLSARVRDALWDRIIAQCGTGKVLMIQTARTETGFTVRQHQYDWNLRDFDGITLLERPNGLGDPSEQIPRAVGWSVARRRRKYRQDRKG